MTQGINRWLTLPAGRSVSNCVSQSRMQGVSGAPAELSQSVQCCAGAHILGTLRGMAGAPLLAGIESPALRQVQLRIATEQPLLVEGDAPLAC